MLGRIGGKNANITPVVPEGREIAVEIDKFSRCKARTITSRERVPCRRNFKRPGRAMKGCPAWLRRTNKGTENRKPWFIMKRKDEINYSEGGSLFLLAQRRSEREKWRLRELRPRGRKGVPAAPFLLKTSFS